MLSSIAASAVPALAVTGVKVLITSNDSDCPWQEKSSKADGEVKVMHMVPRQHQRRGPLVRAYMA